MKVRRPNNKNLKPSKCVVAVAVGMAFLFGALITGANFSVAAEMLNPAAYKRVLKLQEVLEIGDNDQSRSLAMATLSKNKIGAYERALTLHLLSHSLTALGDYLAAVRALEEALTLKAFEPIVTRSVRFNIARLYVANGELDRGLVLLEAWFREAEKPSPDAFMLLAQVYAHKTDFAMALSAAQSAVRLSIEPREGWYRFLSALQYELGDVAGMAEILRVMVVYWPQQERYWNRLAWAYESLEEPAEALAVLEIAGKQGLLIKEEQLMHLARLYLHEGVPNRAARVVRQGLDDRTIDATPENWTFLADALANSEYQDGAINALERAVILTDKSVLHVRLAQAYMWSEEWSEVVRVAQLGLTKNDGLHHGELNLALGIAQFRLSIFNAARKALDHAAQNEKTRERAKQWLALLPQPEKIAHSNGG